MKLAIYIFKYSNVKITVICVESMKIRLSPFELICGVYARI